MFKLWLANYYQRAIQDILWTITHKQHEREVDSHKNHEAWGLYYIESASYMNNWKHVIEANRIFHVTLDQAQ